MASTIANSPSRATRARYGPGPVPNLRHARYRRRCLLIRTTAGGSSGARPQMTCRRGHHGHRLAGCAVARRHRQRGGGSIGNRGAARAAFMAGFDPADDTSRRRVLAPRVSGRSGDRRHRHDRTGTHAGWRSAQREIAPAQLAGRRPPVVPMFCVPAAGMNVRPCRRRRRQYDAGAGGRRRRTGSARTGCSVPLSRSELAIDRQRIVGRA